MADENLKITLTGVRMPGSFLDHSGEVRKQSKKAINLANISQNGKPQRGDELISSFLLSTGGQGSEQRHSNSQAEGQGSLKQAIMYDYNNKSDGKQVKETVPTWSQNWLSPAAPLYPPIYSVSLSLAFLGSVCK